MVKLCAFDDKKCKNGDVIMSNLLLT